MQLQLVCQIIYISFFIYPCINALVFCFLVPYYALGYTIFNPYSTLDVIYLHIVFYCIGRVYEPVLSFGWIRRIYIPIIIHHYTRDIVTFALHSGLKGQFFWQMCHFRHLFLQKMKIIQLLHAKKENGPKRTLRADEDGFRLYSVFFMWTIHASRW